MDSYVSKPISMAELRAAMESAIRSRNPGLLTASRREGTELAFRDCVVEIDTKK
jgi:DNA-binding response OmpR family regulator